MIQKLVILVSILMLIPLVSAQNFNNTNLTDSTIFDNNSNKCFASKSNFSITAFPCVVPDGDGRNIVQNVDLQWNGNIPQPSTWVFIYSQPLIDAKLEMKNPAGNWIDITSQVIALGSGHLGTNNSFYQIQAAVLQPQEKRNFRWTFTPFNHSLSGKWSILGKRTQDSFNEAVATNAYVLLDPSWIAVDELQDDFEDGVINSTLWYFWWANNTAQSPNLNYSFIELPQGIGDGFIQLNNTAIDVGGSNAIRGSMRTLQDYNDNRTHRIRFSLSLQNVFGFTPANDWVAIGIGNNTENTVNQNGSGKDMYFFPNNTLTPQMDYSISIDPRTRNITLYNNSQTLASIIHPFANSSWYIQFSQYSEETDGSVQTILNIFNFFSGVFGVHLVTPEDNSFLNGQNINFTAFSDFYPANLTNMSLHLWRNNILVFNQTKNVTGDFNTTSFFVNLTSADEYLWNVLGCMNNNTCIYARNNFSFGFGADVDEIFDLDVLDTDFSLFQLNISYNSSAFPFIAGSLNYDNVNYSGTKSGTGDNITIIRGIDIPVVSSTTTKNFFWNILIVNESGDSETLSTAIQTQTINPTNISVCSANVPTRTVNYTIFREDTRALVSSPMEITLEWFLGKGTVTKNFSTTSANANSHIFCISPNETYFTNVKLDLEPTGFHPQIYDFILETYSNNLTNQWLGVFNNTAGSSVIVKVKDEGARPLLGWMVQIFKFYPELNEHRIIGSRITDNFGQFEQILIEKDVRYKFDFYNASRVFKESQTGTVSCELTFCFIEFIIKQLINPLQVFDEIEGYERALTFNEDLNRFVFSWSDGTGDTPQHRLIVQSFALNQTFTVSGCNITSSTQVGSLTCNVGNQTASYVATAFRNVGEGEVRVAYLTVRVGDISVTIGAEGLFWAFIVLMISIGIGVFNPTVGIGLFLAGFALLGGFGIFYMPPMVFFAILAIGIVFIWAITRGL